MPSRMMIPAIACLMCMILVACAAPAGAAPKPKKSHAASEVYKQPLDPQANPWKDKGIASGYVFGAYYTRKNVDEKWHRFSRTDEYADVMVKFDNSPDELVFWRGSSYLPYYKAAKGQWAFEELAPRSGDGPEGRPDKVNRHSRATIIESSPKRVVVHWRYLTEFPADVGLQNPPDQTKFIDEYFIVTPDRTVVRAVRPGCPDIESWYDKSRVKVSKLKLAGGGIEPLKADNDDRQAALALMGFEAAPAGVAKASPKRPSPASPTAAISWSFDEGKGRTVGESVTGAGCDIQGHAAIWRAGVSGASLVFDGYTTKVALPAGKAPKIARQVTLEGWIAIAAYPWNYTAVVQQGDVINDGNGYFLGIDADGKPTIAAMIGGAKRVLVADKAEHRIPRFRWTHLAGVIDTEAGTMTLYVDGKPVASAEAPKGKAIDLAAEKPVVIGQGPPMKTLWPVGKPFGKFPYSLDGMIDEVRVYDKALTGNQVAAACKAMAPTEKRRARPDMYRRVLPAGDPGWKNFGAHYTNLKFHQGWDSMFRMSGQPDIVVTFDKQPGRYVLWHGVGYIPMMVTENGRWYSNEFNETWWRGCCEPMSDKKMVFGRVQIIEQSPARVVLKWRYPLSNVGYQIYAENWDDDTGWGEWCDWYMTIYPDGTVAKRMRIYMSTTHSHEWHESMAIFGPEQHPEKVGETQPALIVGTAGGEVRRYDWIDAPPEKVDYTDVILHVANMKAEYDPYAIARVARGNVYSRRGPSPYSVFPAWNHWPVAQIPSDGRFVHYPDRTAHSSLTHIYWADSHRFGEKGTYEEKVLLEGLSNLAPEKLLTLAKSFVDAPAITAGDGATASFDQNQRAYAVQRTSGDVKNLQLTIEASERSPAFNPAIVVDNWGANEPAKIQVNGKAPTKAMDVRQGVVPRANGVNALVIWMELTAIEPVSVRIDR